MTLYNCSSCLKDFEADEPLRRGAICFACHIKTVRLGFTHGKEDFHGPTIRERANEQVRVAAEAGIKAEPIGNRWV